MRSLNSQQTYYAWNLWRIYADRSAWERDLDEARSLALQLMPLQGSLVANIDDLERALALQSNVFMLLEQLYIYPKLRLDLDYRDEEARQMCDLASHASRTILSDLAFLTDELRALDLDCWSEIVGYRQELLRYKRLLHEYKRFDPYLLEAEQENILAQLHQITSNVYQTYRVLIDQETAYPVITDCFGTEITINENNYTLLMEHHDRGTRQQAYSAVIRTLYEKRETFANLLQTYALQQSLNARIRKHNSSFEAALFEEELSTALYAHLIEAVHQQLGLMHRYVHVKKELLGLPKLAPYDLIAPLFGETNPQVPMEEAWNLIEGALAPLGDEYYACLQRLLQAGSIDLFPSQHKTGGAYTWNIYNVHPYVLINYNGNVDSLFGLIHELGHAVHNQFTNMHQPYIYADCPVFLAEIVSNVNECLLIHYLLERVDDERERRYYLSYYLEMFRSTVFRQTMLSEFEYDLYRLLDADLPVTASILDDTYVRLHQTYYGDGMSAESLHGGEWIRVQHLYKHFYMFKYPVGFLIAMQIANYLREQGAAYANKYVTMLKDGNSASATELLRKIDIDIEDPQLFRNGFTVFEMLIQHLEEFCYAQQKQSAEEQPQL